MTKITLKMRINIEQFVGYILQNAFEQLYRYLPEHHYQNNQALSNQALLDVHNELLLQILFVQVFIY